MIFKIDPGVLRIIDPEWKRCGNEQHTAYDPPIALQAVVNVDTPKLAVTAKRTSQDARTSNLALPKQILFIDAPTRTGQTSIVAIKTSR